MCVCGGFHQVVLVVRVLFICVRGRDICVCSWFGTCVEAVVNDTITKITVTLGEVGMMLYNAYLN